MHTCDLSLDERNLQMTIILILVSTTYVLFYLPVLVHFVLFKMQRSDIVDVSMTFLDVFGNYAKTPQCRHLPNSSEKPPKVPIDPRRTHSSPVICGLLNGSSPSFQQM